MNFNGSEGWQYWHIGPNRIHPDKSFCLSWSAKGSTSRRTKRLVYALGIVLYLYFTSTVLYLYLYLYMYLHLPGPPLCGWRPVCTWWTWPCQTSSCVWLPSLSPLSLPLRWATQGHRTELVRHRTQIVRHSTHLVRHITQPVTHRTQLVRPMS